MSLFYSRPTLPVLYESDCVVLSGCFAGISAALQLARRGYWVTLVEPRTYLGREVTATLRPWLETKGKPLADWLAVLVTESVNTQIDQLEYPLQLDQLKIYLEDLLLLGSINLLYASTATQVLEKEGKVQGLVIGNKSGRQVVLGQCLIDASETALLARLANASFEPTPETGIYRSTLELTGAQDFPETILQVPSSIGVWGDAVRLHKSYAGRDPLYVEFALDLPAGADLESAMQRDLQARRTSLRLASHLLAGDSRFYWGNWSGSAHELHGAHTPRLSPGVPSWASGYQNSITEQESIQINAFAGPLEGIWVLSEAARLKESQAWFQDPVRSAWLGDLLGLALPVEAANNIALPGNKSKHIPQNSHQAIPTRLAPSGFEPTEKTTGWVIGELESPTRGKPFRQQVIEPQEIPIFRRCEVLVAGGGTSGAVAGLASGQEGADTLLVEMNPGLGGTGTLGGVATYWMGNRVGFVPRISKSVEEIHRQLNFQPRPPWTMWNQQAKMAALLKEVLQSGVAVFWNAVSIGVILENEHEDKRVCGAVLATRYGPIAILAEVVIDATGDGDLAAFAGADWVVGDEYDAATMWSAFPFIHAPGDGNGGNFTSAVDVGDILDLTRGILAGRRRNYGAISSQFTEWPGKEQHESGVKTGIRTVARQKVIHDHGIYLPPRESRHVRGDVVMTLTDQLRHRKWRDVVTVCFSNYDVKGQTTTDWNRMGLLPPNLMIEVPYRALLPKGINGLIIAGKAISARSDAVPSVRMQPDMENLGGASGIAAAIAVHSRCLPREIDIHHLQHRLVEGGVLPVGITDREWLSHDYTQEELVELAAQIQFNPQPWEYNNMPLSEVFKEKIPLVEAASAGARAIPILEQEFHRARGERKVFLAQALALCGSQAGVEVLVERLQEMFAGERLPARQAFMFNANRVPPDQGAMPEAVYLLYSLGMAQDERSLPVWEEVLELLDVDITAFWDARAGSFHYIHAVCYGIERLAHPGIVPALSNLHAQPVWQDLSRKMGFEPDFMVERLASLEVAIGRALARCASREGYQILIQYLDDPHSLLSEAAHLGLRQITRLDLGKDPHAWQAWLEAQQVFILIPLNDAPNIESDLTEAFYN